MNQNDRPAHLACMPGTYTHALKPAKQAMKPAGDPLAITVKRVMKKSNSLFDGRFIATCRATGRHICTSTEPFFASARVFLSEGHDPATVLLMFHEGGDVPAMRWPLGRAAGCTVKEGSRQGPIVARYRPFNGQAVQSDGVEPAGVPAWTWPPVPHTLKQVHASPKAAL